MSISQIFPTNRINYFPTGLLQDPAPDADDEDENKPGTGSDSLAAGASIKYRIEY